MMPLVLTDLQPGDRVEVIRTFRDFDGIEWAQGQVLEYEGYSYFPYDGGYAFRFVQGVLRLAHVGDERVLRDPGEYFRRV